MNNATTTPEAAAGVPVPSTRLFAVFFGLPVVSEHWRLCRDGNDDARAIFDRHYSRYVYADGRKPKLFVGPGEKMVLVSEDADALLVWRKFIDASGNQGVNCAIFRNEGPVLSSTLIREADALAWARWPGQRLYTYVNPRAVRGDGACFKHAGWRRCGRTAKRRYVVLEHLPANNSSSLGA
jgi:hypothetical protein